MSIRLWHDDIRRPPDEGWTWARTNKEAMEILGGGEVVEISMDHDLGLHEIDPDASLEMMSFAGRSPDGSGYDLVCWMCENGVVPAIITIHSWNPDGARNMAARFNHFGHNVVVQPFRVPQKGST